jgi:hypothetical protein
MTMRTSNARPSTAIRIAVAAVWVVAGALAAGRADAQSKTGTTIGQFLLIEPSARYTALGNTGVTAESDLDGVYYNPANAARLEHLGFQFLARRLVRGHPLRLRRRHRADGEVGDTFATITSLNSGDIDVRTVSQPLGTGETFTVSNIALGVGYSYAVTDRFAGGIQARWLQETIWHSSASTMSFDVGAMYRLAESGLHLGSSITNFGTTARYSGRDLDITYDNDPRARVTTARSPATARHRTIPCPSCSGSGSVTRIASRPSGVRGRRCPRSHPSDNSESVSGGVELSYRELFACAPATRICSRRTRSRVSPRAWASAASSPPRRTASTTPGRISGGWKAFTGSRWASRSRRCVVASGCSLVRTRVQCRKPPRSHAANELLTRPRSICKRLHRYGG